MPGNNKGRLSNSDATRVEFSNDSFDSDGIWIPPAPKAEEDDGDYRCENNRDEVDSLSEKQKLGLKQAIARKWALYYAGEKLSTEEQRDPLELKNTFNSLCSNPYFDKDRLNTFYDNFINILGGEHGYSEKFYIYLEDIDIKKLVLMEEFQPDIPYQASKNPKGDESIIVNLIGLNQHSNRMNELSSRTNAITDAEELKESQGRSNDNSILEILKDFIMNFPSIFVKFINDIFSMITGSNKSDHESERDVRRSKP